MRRWFWILSLWAACSPSADVVKVPITSGTQTMILATIIDGATTLRGIAVDGESKFFTLQIPDGARLIALEYTCSSEALQLAAGLIGLDPAGRSIPTPRSAREANVAGGEAIGWTEVALPAELAALRIAGEPTPAPTPCVKLISTRFALPPEIHGQANIAVALDDRRALVALSAGHFFVSTPDGVEAVALSSSTPSVAAFRRGEELFLIGNGGAMVRGDLSLSFAAAPSLPDGESGARWLSGSTAGDVLELFAAHDRGQMARFDGQQWIAIGAGDPDVPHGGVAWIGPDEAVFAGLNQPDVYYYRAGVLTPEELPGLSSLDFPTTAAFIEGFGVLVGTQAGVVYQRRARSWDRLFELGRPQTIHRIVPIDGGVLVGARFELVQYHPSFGVCAPQSDELELGDNDAMIELGEGWLVAGSSDPDGYVLRLERAPPAPDLCAGGGS